MAAFTEGAGFSTSANGKTLDPRLLDILKTAAQQYGLDVQATSGVQGRSTGTKNHPGGFAVDIKLVDPSTGKALPNYHQDIKGSFPAYEKFAQTARVVQQQKYPELDKAFRWGGYFQSGVNPADLMHFDINPKMNGAMGGGSWNGGATDAFKKAWGITAANPGLGSIEGQRQVASIKQGLSGGPLPPMNIPQVGTALDTIDRAFPRPMPSQIASAYASTQAPPRLPANSAVPRLQADNTLSYGQKSGITADAKGAAGRSAFDVGLGALSDPRTSALLAPTRMPPSLAAAGQATAMPQSVGISGAASLSGPTVQPGMMGRGLPSAASAPQPMPGRPAALNSVPLPPAPRPTITVNPLPSAYTLNPTAMVDAAKKAGVISGPASWLPDQTIWDGAMGQQGMRDRIATALPQGSSLDPKTNTVHVADPQALANSYLQKVPSLFRPMAREAVAPAIHYAESAGFVQPQWPPSQTFPMPVPRPATPIHAPTAQDTLNEQAQMRRAAVPALPAVAAGVSPSWWSQAFPTPAPVYPPVNLNRPVGVLPSYVMPRSLPNNFYAQPAQTSVAASVAAPRIVAPVPMPAPSQSNGGGYANGRQNAINDTLRTLGFNV